MGKRSDFGRIPKDKYRTFDPKAGRALAPFLSPGQRYWEPCAGARDLVDQIKGYGPECVLASDIAPDCERVKKIDALTIKVSTLNRCGVTHIITNPPWSRPILHQMIPHFASMRPSWLLFDADWAFTKQAAPFLPMLARVVAIGRLRFIPGTTMSGKDNCAWYLFDARHTGHTEFVGVKCQ